jgi:cytochrome P450
MMTNARMKIRGKLPEEPEIPSHVPLELVMEPMAWDDTTTDADAFSITERALDELPPIFFSPRPRYGVSPPAWVVTHHADIRRVYERGELYSTKGAAGFNQLVGETFPMIPLGIDPPLHGKYRMFLNPKFSPRAIADMETAIQKSINDLIDGFVDKGSCDAAYEFGRVYPVQVFLDLMGFPQNKLEDFLSWGYAILHTFGDIEKIQWGMGNAINWLREFVEETRGKPSDSLTSYIVHGEIDGRPLTDDEIIGTLTFLWLGGLDTVAATTALMFRRLAMQPELQQQLRDNPDLINNAVEEFLRMAPLVNSARLVKQDHEIRGIQIKAGDWIICANNVGNFDPEQFPDPREVRFDRASNRHFSFAGGPHLCLGIHLARRELRIALGEFLRRVPPFTLAPDAPREAFPGLIAAPRVPIVWTV